MNLIDPSKKMSKSDENPKGVIYLLDKEEDIRKKIMSATTDSEMIVKYDLDNKPGISNLINLYSALSSLSIIDVEDKFKNCNYGEFKKAVADLVIDILSPIQKRYYEILESDTLDKILEYGKTKTTKIAKEKYELLRNIVGLHL